MSAKVYISDPEPTGHGATVKQAIFAGGNGLLVDSDVAIDSTADMFNTLSLAAAAGAKIVVRSMTDIQTCIGIAQSAFLQSGIMSFMPGGPNILGQTILNPDEIPVGIITSSAILQSGQNAQASFGNWLEFVGIDQWFGDGAQESGVNGYIAGQIYAIMAARGCNAMEARICARATASNGGVWNMYNGFGEINVAAAIAYVIPTRQQTMNHKLMAA